MELGFNGIADVLQKQKSIGFHDVYNDRNNLHDADQTFVSNTTTFELFDDFTIKNIFGYNDVFSLDQNDIDGSPYQWLRIGVINPILDESAVDRLDRGYNYGTKQISNELQLTGKVGRANIIVGAFLSEEKSLNRVPLTAVPDLGQPAIGRYLFTVKDKSKALFAQVTYAATDRLNLTGGFRYTWEDISIEEDPTSLFAFLNAGITERKDRKPSWLAGIDYHVTDSLMVYFNHRGSWRTGGFNGTETINLQDITQFKPETTYDFEAGAKFSGTIGGMRASLNAAVFDQYIKNVQRTLYIGVSALSGNVNKARVTGFELDGRINLTDWLEIGGAFSCNNARYTDPIATVNGANFFFGPYADAPKRSGSAYFRVSKDMAAGGEISLRGDMYSQSGLVHNISVSHEHR